MKGSATVLDEFHVASLFQALLVSGLGLFALTYALLLRRAIGGDSLAFFAGNTVAAVLLLASNLGGFDLTLVLAQIALVAALFGLMILVFLAETAGRGPLVRQG